MKSIAILGAGPAGLFAAHAVRQAGYEPVVYSKDARRSFMRGAQYLHRPVPGLSGQSFEIEYRLVGTADGYRSKVYGEDSDLNVSPESLVGISPAWDIRAAYEAAWSLYGNDRVVPWDANPIGLAAVTDGLSHSAVVSTIPARLLCQTPKEHVFASQSVWSTNFLKNDRTFSGQDNLVVCSGRSDDWWYRMSRIHGWENTEYPLARPPQAPEDRVWKVEKPLVTNCDCRPEILRVGRYGEWRKGVLADEGYYRVASWLRGLALV